MNRTLQKAIRAEYSILRTPLSVLDQRVISRLDETLACARSTFERGLESLDAAAARLLNRDQGSRRPCRPRSRRRSIR